MLRELPDTNLAGRNHIIKEAQAVYSTLLAGLETFAVWECNNPKLTLQDTIEWFEPTPNATQTSGSASEHASYTEDLAPTWHPSLMKNTNVCDSLERSLEQTHLEFPCTISAMAASLREAAVDTSVTFLLRGAAQPAEPRYHGTSWTGLVGISQGGFLPCWVQDVRWPSRSSRWIYPSYTPHRTGI